MRKVDEDNEISDDKDDEEWKLVSICMLNYVNNMNWNILIDLYNENYR